LNLEVQLDLYFDISDYQLNSFYTALDGSVQANVEADLTIQYIYSYEWSNLLGVIQVPSVDFVIAGVPMVLQINIPVTVGFELNATATGSTSASVGATAEIVYGINYDGSNWSPVHNHSYTTYGNLPSTLDTQFTAGFMVYLFPTPILYIDYIGGPYAGFKPFIEVGIYTDPDSCTGGANVVLNWGLTVTMGINISINFDGQTVPLGVNAGPWDIYSVKQPIAQGCVSTNNVLYDNGNILTGNVWSGAIGDNSDYDKGYGDMAMQLVDMDDQGNYYLAGSYSISTDENGACVIQALFSGSLQSDGSWVFDPVLDDEGNEIIMESCQVGDPFTAVSWSGYFSSDFSTLTLPNDPYPAIVLNRNPSS
jgi:hypothetical protein